jgi:hypothetical protein
MEIKELKAKLLKKCIDQQSDVIQHLENEINEAQKQANEYGQPKDRYDAFRTKLMRQIELYAKQLDMAKLVINTLRKIEIDNKLVKVEFGALVITNKQKLFVSAGLGKIEMDGENYYAISPQVPIFNALKGKMKDEKAVFNDITLIIKDIC